VKTPFLFFVCALVLFGSVSGEGRLRYPYKKGEAYKKKRKKKKKVVRTGRPAPLFLRQFWAGTKNQAGRKKKKNKRGKKRGEAALLNDGGQSLPHPATGLKGRGGWRKKKKSRRPTWTRRPLPVRKVKKEKGKEGEREKKKKKKKKTPPPPPKPKTNKGILQKGKMKKLLLHPFIFFYHSNNNFFLGG